jgi:hypothetical protein
MASNPPTPANLPCPQCGFVNEAERVYCHNCGSKLDRSLLPTHDEKGEDSPEKARKRISKITNPKASVVFQEVKTFLKVEIFAVIVAALFLIAQKPDGVPEMKKAGIQRLINSDMMEALQSPKPSLISFTQEEVNQHLKKTVKTQETLMPGVEISRVYAEFTPGVIRMGTENSLFGYPIYAEIAFHVEVKGGKFTTSIVSGNLGRLALDPRILRLPFGQVLFQGSWAALKHERGQMDKMERVDVKKEEITLVTKGGGR